MFKIPYRTCRLLIFLGARNATISLLWGFSNKAILFCVFPPQRAKWAKFQGIPFLRFWTMHFRLNRHQKPFSSNFQIPIEYKCINVNHKRRTTQSIFIYCCHHTSSVALASIFFIWLLISIFSFTIESCLSCSSFNSKKESCNMKI